MLMKVLFICLGLVVVFSGCILDQVLDPTDPTDPTDPETEILYSSDFTGGDPYADGAWDQSGDGVYGYVVDGDRAYVTLQADPQNGHTFRLKFEEPHWYSWNREPDVKYVLETDIKIITLGRWPSFSFHLMGPSVDRYSVSFGSGHDDYNIRLDRSNADNPVAHDSLLSEVFTNGQLAPAYQDEWIPIRLELKGGEIDLWVDDVHVVTHNDADPILEDFGVRFYVFGSEIAIDNVLLYTVQDQ